VAESAANESLTLDLVVVLYAITIMVVFVLGSGSFVYPAIAITIAVAWQIADWQGGNSLRVLLSVLSAAGLGLVLRRISGKPVATSQRDGKVVLIATGVFGAVFLPVVVIGAALS
jgi:hypothetical protein